MQHQQYTYSSSHSLPHPQLTFCDSEHANLTPALAMPETKAFQMLSVSTMLRLAVCLPPRLFPSISSGIRCGEEE